MSLICSFTSSQTNQVTFVLRAALDDRSWSHPGLRHKETLTSWLLSSLASLSSSSLLLLSSCSSSCSSCSSLWMYSSLALLSSSSSTRFSSVSWQQQHCKQGRCLIWLPFGNTVAKVHVGFFRESLCRHRPGHNTANAAGFHQWAKGSVTSVLTHSVIVN